VELVHGSYGSNASRASDSPRLGQHERQTTAKSFGHRCHTRSFFPDCTGRIAAIFLSARVSQVTEQKAPIHEPAAANTT
jgi:hypothetical protein